MMSDTKQGSCQFNHMDLHTNKIHTPLHTIRFTPHLNISDRNSKGTITKEIPQKNDTDTWYY